MRSKPVCVGSCSDKTLSMEHFSYFHFNTKIGALFIKECEITSTQAFIAVCVTIFLVSVSFECLRYSRAWLMNRHATASLPHDTSLNTSSCSCEDNCDVLVCEAAKLNSTAHACSPAGHPGGDRRLGARPRNKPLSRAHVMQTLLHLLQVTLGYLIMLSVMTYQVLLGVAIVVGAGLGYFFFANFMMRDLPAVRLRKLNLPLAKMAATGSKEITQELLDAQI